MTGALRALGVISSAFMITLISSRGAEAGLVTVDFSGSVSVVDTSLITGTKVGDSYSGTLVYDSSTPETSMSGADPATYTALPPLASGLGITLTVGGKTYTAELGDTEQLTVAYHFMGTSDVFAATAYVNVGGSATLASFGVRDTTGTVFSSTALPTSLDLSKFTDGEFTLAGPPGGTNIFQGTINLQSVPEPASAVLLGAGGAGRGGLFAAGETGSSSAMWGGGVKSGRVENLSERSWPEPCDLRMGAWADPTACGYA